MRDARSAQGEYGDEAYGDERGARLRVVVGTHARHASGIILFDVNDDRSEAVVPEEGEGGREAAKRPAREGVGDRVRVADEKHHASDGEARKAEIPCDLKGFLEIQRVRIDVVAMAHGLRRIREL